MFKAKKRNRPITKASVCLFLILTVFNQASARAHTKERAVAENAERHLVICVDGIGFSLLEKMRTENRFRDFRQPGRMIAPFPTLTNVAMTEIMSPLGVEAANGYEDSYYDVSADKMRGGLLDRFRRKTFIGDSFRQLFDYHPSALKSGIGYAAPPLTTYLEALTDLIRLKQKFNASKQPVFYAYLGATDSLAHLGGKRLVSSYLAKLDDTIRALRRRHGANLKVTIFSDHGNDFRDYERVDLGSALRRRGFKTGKRLAHKQSVVIPQFGLIGCAVIFTAAGKEREVADALRTVEGVDFVSFTERDTVRIFAPDNGEATIERRGSRYRYTARSGDPLELTGVLKNHVATKADADKFIEDADLFFATTTLARPDAVRRVYEGTMNGVRNRASVIVNFKDGYYAGSRTLDLFAFLQATHGNIGREQSLGFVISTNREMPAYTRARDLWTTIGAPELSRAHEYAERRATK